MSVATIAPTISPRAGLLLTQLTKTADFDAALWKLLLDYLDLKLQTLAAENEAFIQKMGCAVCRVSAQDGDEFTGAGCLLVCC